MKAAYLLAMWSTAITVGVGTNLMAVAEPVDAAVLCQRKKSGRLAIRETKCKKKETRPLCSAGT
jgi:hypothetical protein